MQMKNVLFKKKESKLSRRITWRVILIMAVFNLFIFGVVLLSDFALAEIQSQMRAQHIIYNIDGKLVTMFKTVEIATINNVAEIEANLDNPAKVYDALEHEFRLNDRYVGCAVAFEPNYYASQGKWFEPYVSFLNGSNERTGNGEDTQIERKQIGSALHDYFSQEWYAKGLDLEKGKGYLTDPYHDKEGGGRFLCSYVSPVFERNGRKVAVYSIDLNLDWLVNTIISEENKIKKLESVENESDSIDEDNALFIQILDSKGRKIAGSEDFDEKTLQNILKKDSIEFEKIKMKGTTYFISSKRIANTGWTLVVAQHIDFVFLYGYALGIIVIFFMIVGCIVMFFYTRHSIRRATKPLGFLSDSAQEVAKGNFDTELPTFKYQDEIARLRDSFGTMQQSLKGYVEELKESTALKASIESELNVAHGIQMSMLPKTFPPFPNRDDIEVYAIQNPAKAVGGDLYDFFIRDEKLFFCIGDVSGKGVPASLVMAVTRTLFRNVAAHTAKPGHIVETMNMSICEGNEENMFVTLFIGVLDLSTGLLRYCNAGHEAPYVQGVLLPCNPNLPIGVMPEWNYIEQEVMIASNTTIFLYTDGLTEAENVVYEQFGESRTTSVIHATKNSPQELIDAMADAVHQFIGETEQSDDLTMLAIKYMNA